MTVLGEDHWKLVPGFSWTSPHVSFLFADSGLYPFAVVNQSHEYDCMLSLVSPLRKSSDLEVVLETSDTLYEKALGIELDLGRPIHNYVSYYVCDFGNIT